MKLNGIKTLSTCVAIPGRVRLYPAMKLPFTPLLPPITGRPRVRRTTLVATAGTSFPTTRSRSGIVG